MKNFKIVNMTIYVLISVFMFTLPTFAQEMDDIDSEMETFLEKNPTIPSVQAVILNRTPEENSWEVFWSKAYGHQQLPRIDDNLASVDTIYAFGSITKTFTATAILKLKEMGAIIDLDDGAHIYLGNDFPDIHNLNPNNVTNADTLITVRDLLNHRSGLGHYGAEKTFFNPQPHKKSIFNPDIKGVEYGVPSALWEKDRHWWDINKSAEHVLTKEYKDCDPLKFWQTKKPAENENGIYSNFGYILLGYIIDKTAAKIWPYQDDWSSYIYTKILAPLEMRSTRFYWIDFDDSEFNVAKAYLPAFPFGDDYPEFGVLWPFPLSNQDAGFSEGGMKGTARDLGKFFAALLNNGTGYIFDNNDRIEKPILGEDSIEDMRTYKELENQDYGMGWQKQWIPAEKFGEMRDTLEDEGFLLRDNDTQMLEYTGHSGSVGHGTSIMYRFKNKACAADMNCVSDGDNTEKDLAIVFNLNQQIITESQFNEIIEMLLREGIKDSGFVGEVKGLLPNGETGLIPGVEITFTSADGQIIRQVKSDADGTYKIHLSKGNYRACAKVDGYVNYYTENYPENYPLVVTGNDDYDTEDFQLTFVPGDFCGDEMVYDCDGYCMPAFFAEEYNEEDGSGGLIGNGFCNDGYLATLTCPEFYYDGGDCN